MSPTHPGLYVLSIVLLAVSLLSFAIMQIVVPVHDNRKQAPLPQRRNFWAVPWFVCAIVAGVLLFPAAGVTRAGNNGFGNPGHLFGWLGAEAAIWLFGSAIIFKVTSRFSGNPQHH